MAQEPRELTFEEARPIVEELRRDIAMLLEISDPANWLGTESLPFMRVWLPYNWVVRIRSVLAKILDSEDTIYDREFDMNLVAALDMARLAIRRIEARENDIHESRQARGYGDGFGRVQLDDQERRFFGWMIGVLDRRLGERPPLPKGVPDDGEWMVYPSITAGLDALDHSRGGGRNKLDELQDKGAIAWRFVKEGERPIELKILNRGLAMKNGGVK